MMAIEETRGRNIWRDPWSNRAVPEKCCSASPGGELGTRRRPSEVRIDLKLPSKKSLGWISPHGPDQITKSWQAISVNTLLYKYLGSFISDLGRIGL